MYHGIGFVEALVIQDDLFSAVISVCLSVHICMCLYTLFSRQTDRHTGRQIDRETNR